MTEAISNNKIPVDPYIQNNTSYGEQQFNVNGAGDPTYAWLTQQLEDQLPDALKDNPNFMNELKDDVFNSVKYTPSGPVLFTFNFSVPGFNITVAGQPNGSTEITITPQKQ